MRLQADDPVVTPSMRRPALVTVAVPVADASALTRQLTALKRQTYREPWELLLVDNGAGARLLLALAESAGVSARVVREPRRGAAHARNAALVHASGDLLVFCDAD